MTFLPDCCAELFASLFVFSQNHPFWLNDLLLRKCTLLKAYVCQMLKKLVLGCGVSCLVDAQAL